jgi:uncharacterized RDD family membrane protein YckC/Tfp pilus assembly major pilin PilA
VRHGDGARSLAESLARGNFVSETKWYYMDCRGQRQGPVADVDVVAAYRNGGVLRDGLVWHEGMPQWLPLRQMDSELGLDRSDQASAPPPLPEAPRDMATTRPRDVDRNEIADAGFLRRWAALCLDNLIMIVPLFVIFFALGMLLAISGTHQSDQDPPLAVMLAYALWFLARMLYFTLMESSAYQATFGKRALGIKVTDDNGRRLSFSHALGRWFAAALSYPLYIGFLMAAFTERKRALHDMVASSLVVDRWAYTEFPERQQRSPSGCLVAFLIVVIGFVPLVGILAAIAIPQYQDYVIRAQVAEGEALSDGAKTAIAEFYHDHGHYPATNASAGLASASSIRGQYVSSIDVGSADGTIAVTYSSSRPQKANTAIHMKTLLLVPNAFPDRIEWRCTSPNLKQKWCSHSCECSG